MNNPVINIFILSILTLALSSCGETGWEVSYRSELSTGSEGYTVSEDRYENVYLQGVSMFDDLSRSVFVSKYNKQGEFLWDFTLPQSYVTNESSKKSKLHDVFPDGSVVFSARSLISGDDHLIRLSPDGDLLWDVAVFSNGIPMEPYDVQVISKDLVMVLSGYHGLAAYNDKGEWLWSKMLSSNPSEVLIHANSIHSNEFGIFVSMGAKISKIDEEGNEIVSITPEQVGAEYFTSFDVKDDTLVLVAVNGAKSDVIVLDNTLNEIYRKSFDTASFSMSASVLDDKSACFAYSVNETEAIAVSRFNGEGNIFTKEISLLDQKVWLDHVTSAGSFCTVSFSSYLEGGTLNQHINQLDAQGEVANSLEIVDVQAFSILEKDSRIYAAGISNGTEFIDVSAKLIKHIF